ncbi:glycosyltransferase family 2 protein [Ruminococcus sp.]|uniref:glycosyltransferase family 2 protein n=1 Tax=Ruminococcus sp. TaxID=41978 RepID=UPI0025FB3427|nr:glycosyltransferase family 2 protein [Ruminococcus sp.]MCI6615881.1 glycosyltransferase family 2 protein [Ruminococcus sp.]
MKTIDLVVPCYNEEAGLEHFVLETNKVIDSLPDYSFRYILVNDGSRDKTYLVMKKLAKQFSNIKYICFSRNFGKEAAMYAGLQHTTADYVVVMDADLQHPPEIFPQMIMALENEGYDCCATKRDEREGESKFRGIFSKLFFKLSNKLTDVKNPYGAMDYRMMTRQMVDSILELGEVQRFSKGIFSWVGFNTKWVSFKTVDRQLGTTTWKFSSLFKYALDGITCFSVAPLRFTAVMGGVIFLISLIYILITLIQTLFFGITTPGYVTTLCAVLFLGGITEMSIGILGEYIGRIYMESKDRPIYITKYSNFEEENNEEEDSE